MHGDRREENCNTLKFELLNSVVLKINVRLHLNMKCNSANMAQKRRKYLYGLHYVSTKGFF